WPGTGAVMKRRDFLITTGAGSVFFTSSILGGIQLLKADAAHPDVLASADAVLRIDATGHVVFTSPYTEMGQGSPTAAAMILADELHTDLDRLELRFHDGRIVQTDPTFDKRFNGGGSGGSQSVTTAWPAIREIGATARTTLIQAAAAAWAVDAGDCDTEADHVAHQPSGRRLAYGELVAAAAQQALPAEVRYR